MKLVFTSKMIKAVALPGIAFLLFLNVQGIGVLPGDYVGAIQKET